MSKPKLTPQEQRDLEYHEWCRAALPPEWQLYGSTFGYGCSAYPKGRTRCDEFPHGVLEEFARLRERIEKLEAEVGECAWKEDYNGNWETSCNEIFIIMEGSPEENSMHYCTYCGKKLMPVHYAQEEVDK